MLSELTKTEVLNLIGELRIEIEYRKSGRESVPASVSSVYNQLKQLCLPRGKR